MRRADNAERFGHFGSTGLRVIVIAMMVLTTGAPDGFAATHKPRRTVPAASTRDTDTSATGTVPTKPPTSQPQVSAGDGNGTLPPPFHLPQASRARMRDCGLKWQAMKTSGDTGEEIWRDYATRCLAAANGPFDKRSDR